MKVRKFNLAVVAAALISAFPLSASSESDTSFARFIVTENCPKMLVALLSSPFMQPILEKRPISTAEVCSCAADVVLRDERISHLASLSREELISLTDTDLKLQSYFLGRALQASMACASQQLDATLSVAGPSLVQQR